jgi:hypothetical protein
MMEPSSSSAEATPPLPVLPPGEGTTPAPAAVRTLMRAVNAALDVADDLADTIARAIDSIRGKRS